MEQQAERRAIFWRADPVLNADMRNAAANDLHREAGKRGFSCWPTKSHITGGYYAEIMKHEKTGRSSIDEHGHEWPEWRSIPNVAMGTAQGPLEAALDGYIKAVPYDDVWGCVVLLVQIELLSRAVAKARTHEQTLTKLDATLDDLTAALALVNVER